MSDKTHRTETALGVAVMFNRESLYPLRDEDTIDVEELDGTKHTITAGHLRGCIRAFGHRKQEHNMCIPLLPESSVADYTHSR